MKAIEEEEADNEEEKRDEEKKEEPALTEGKEGEEGGGTGKPMAVSSHVHQVSVTSLSRLCHISITSLSRLCHISVTSLSQKSVLNDLYQKCFVGFRTIRKRLATAGRAPLHCCHLASSTSSASRV